MAPRMDEDTTAPKTASSGTCGVGLVDFGVEVALFGFEVASHGHDVLDYAFELGFWHWWGLVVHDGGVDIVGESEVEAHGVVVGGVVVIAGEVEAELVDDFGAHADPLIEGFL